MSESSAAQSVKFWSDWRQSSTILRNAVSSAIEDGRVAMDKTQLDSLTVLDLISLAGCAGFVSTNGFLEDLKPSSCPTKLAEARAYHGRIQTYKTQLDSVVDGTQGYRNGLMDALPQKVKRLEAGLEPYMSAAASSLSEMRSNAAGTGENSLGEAESRYEAAKTLRSSILMGRPALGCLQSALNAAEASKFAKSAVTILTAMKQRLSETILYPDPDERDVILAKADQVVSEWESFLARSGFTADSIFQLADDQAQATKMPWKFTLREIDDLFAHSKEVRRQEILAKIQREVGSAASDQSATAGTVETKSPTIDDGVAGEQEAEVCIPPSSESSEPPGMYRDMFDTGLGEMATESEPDTKKPFEERWAD